MKTIENKSFDEERALYGSDGVSVINCSFDGPADGESAFKESRNINAEHCRFNLRYPFWHDTDLCISNCEMTENCRAALWYSHNIKIQNTELYGIKALRECCNVAINECDINSPEFGWSVHNISMKDTSAVSEYFMMRSEDILFSNVRFKGKYSFQYIKNAVFENCEFDTKDAFWHGENITVRDSTINGEYLAWYSQNLTLINCKISGTQPFCYCKGLRLINCELTNADLAFEKSDVIADITTEVVSIKNPRSGQIRLPALGKLIMVDENAKGEVVITGGK